MKEGLFSEGIDETKEHVGRPLAQNTVDAIILVDGFSESKLLYKSVKEAFENTKMLNPDECGLSVLKWITTSVDCKKGQQILVRV